MDLSESNPQDFPAFQRAIDKRFFIRFGNAGNLLKIIKSVTLPGSNMALFISDGNQVRIMTESHNCVQGIHLVKLIFKLIILTLQGHVI